MKEIHAITKKFSRVEKICKKRVEKLLVGHKNSRESKKMSLLSQKFTRVKKFMRVEKILASEKNLASLKKFSRV